MSSQTAQHGIAAHTDGGWDLVPVQTRNERFVSTDVAAFPAVSGRESVWKFTPVAKIEALLNDTLDGSKLPQSTSFTDGVTLEWTPRAESHTGQAGLPEERASANAWGQVAEVLTLSIRGENQTATFVRDSLGVVPRAAHTVIVAAANSSGVVVLRNFGEANLSENVEIILEDGAQLTVVTVQQWANTAHHLASHFAKLGRDASLKHIVVSLSGEVVRVNPSVHLASTGANIDAFGAYFASAHEHLEQQVYIDHDAPHTRSRVTYKGALHGAGARSVWIGDVLIRRSASGTDSYEQNRNLVLSDGTRADSIPNLEIETGDIEGAGHASATGRFDDEQLFYLMARGISEDEARKLVVRGFLMEVINQIDDPELVAELQNEIEQELVATDGQAK